MKLHNRKYIRVRDFLAMIEEVDYPQFDITLVNPNGTYQHIVNAIDGDYPEAYFKHLFNYIAINRVFGKYYVLSVNPYEYSNKQSIHIYITERKPK